MTLEAGGARASSSTSSARPATSWAAPSTRPTAATPAGEVPRCRPGAVPRPVRDGGRGHRRRARGRGPRPGTRRAGPLALPPGPRRRARALASTSPSRPTDGRPGWEALLFSESAGRFLLVGRAGDGRRARGDGWPGCRWPGSAPSTPSGRLRIALGGQRRSWTRTSPRWPAPGSGKGCGREAGPRAPARRASASTARTRRPRPSAWSAPRWTWSTSPTSSPGATRGASPTTRCSPWWAASPTATTWPAAWCSPPASART